MDKHQPALDDIVGRGFLHRHYKAVKIRLRDPEVVSPRISPVAAASDSRAYHSVRIQKHL